MEVTYFLPDFKIPLSSFTGYRAIILVSVQAISVQHSLLKHVTFRIFTTKLNRIWEKNLWELAH